MRFLSSSKCLCFNIHCLFICQLQQPVFSSSSEIISMKFTLAFDHFSFSWFITSRELWRLKWTFLYSNIYILSNSAEFFCTNYKYFCGSCNFNALYKQCENPETIFLFFNFNATVIRCGKFAIFFIMHWYGRIAAKIEQSKITRECSWTEKNRHYFKLDLSLHHQLIILLYNGWFSSKIIEWTIQNERSHAQKQASANEQPYVIKWNVKCLLWLSKKVLSQTSIWCDSYHERHHLTMHTYTYIVVK